MQAGWEGHTHKPRDAGDCSHHQKLGEEHREDAPCSLQRGQPGRSSFSGSSLQTEREQLALICNFPGTVRLCISQEQSICVPLPVTPRLPC